MTDTIKLNRDEVEELFRVSTNQVEVILGLYRMVFSNWDDVIKVDGYPKINEWTNRKLFNLFIEFDHKHHPDVMAAGLWLNNGFSQLDVGDSLTDWEVEPCGVELKEAL